MKGDISATVGHTHLQGRTRRERKMEPSTRQNRTSGIRTTGFLVVILDTTTEEQESDTTKKGQENSTEENRIGREG